MDLRPQRLLATIALAIACSAAFAQDRFPAKPIQFIVPLPSGATVDVLARWWAERLASRMQHPVVVQNRPGAGGTIAALAVLQASADGHTLFFTNSQLSISAAMREPLPYDALRDFTGLALVAEAPSLVVVTPGLGVRSLQEFLALAREKPGAIHFGGGAVGTATHMAGAYFAHRAGIRLTHVPYKEANVVGDLVTGRIQAMFVPIPFLQAQIRDGKLVALAVTSPAGLSRPFKVPAAADSGLPGYEYQTWYGIVAPREVPAAVLDRLATELRQVAREPELGERLLAQGMSPRAITTGEFDAYIRADVERLAPVVKASTDK